MPGPACRVEPSPAERAALKDKIRRLLKERNAVMVSHYYVHPDLQDLAEETGGIVSDSLEMARFGRDHAAQTLVVSGVRFMGETAKILSPEKRVLMPDLDATCSLDLGCPIDEFSAFCDQHPGPHRGGLCQHQRRGEGARRLAGHLELRAGHRARAQGQGPQDPVGARQAPGRLHPARDRRRHGVLERRVHRARRVQGVRARSAEEGSTPRPRCWCIPSRRPT